jgi:hypothetical protein
MPRHIPIQIKALRARVERDGVEQGSGGDMREIGKGQGSSGGDLSGDDQREGGGRAAQMAGGEIAALHCD